MPINFVSYAVQFFLIIGMMRLCLAAARKEPLDLKMLVSGGSWLLPVFGESILVGIGTTIGLLFCVVPGVILALGTSQ